MKTLKTMLFILGVIACIVAFTHMVFAECYTIGNMKMCLPKKPVEKVEVRNTSDGVVKFTRASYNNDSIGFAIYTCQVDASKLKKKRGLKDILILILREGGMVLGPAFETHRIHTVPCRETPGCGKYRYRIVSQNFIHQVSILVTPPKGWIYIGILKFNKEWIEFWEGARISAPEFEKGAVEGKNREKILERMKRQVKLNPSYIWGRSRKDRF